MRICWSLMHETSFCVRSANPSDNSIDFVAQFDLRQTFDYRSQRCSFSVELLNDFATERVIRGADVPGAAAIVTPPRSVAAERCMNWLGRFSISNILSDRRASVGGARRPEPDALPSLELVLDFMRRRVEEQGEEVAILDGKANFT